ncbi:hypothetical protein EJ08DRAFT_702604 [Tothia fuscella]|uniref:Uncharacterized protein n=1 Tax=Tothia fuscella TaxID=1048955 RepID=A0A9P4TTK7_9PEZI|nr:hypothetical protein EJ08DRAFT_702604 [Tothia fuscella]
MLPNHHMSLVLMILFSVLKLISAAPAGVPSARTDYPSITKVHSPGENTTDISSINARAPGFGVAIDLCRDKDYNNCKRNVHLDDRKCYDFGFIGPDTLSSIGFAGNMWCAIFAGYKCDWYPTAYNIFESIPDLSAIPRSDHGNWNDAARSI